MPSYARPEAGRNYDESTVPPVISNIIVKVHRDSGYEPDLTELAEAMIFPKIGDVFSSSLLQSSIKALRLSNRFSEINVDSKEEEGKMTLYFELHPAPLIKEIELSGIYPFFERDILKIMTFNVGDIFSFEEIENQKSIIKEFFKNEGFIDPLLTIETRKDSGTGHVILNIHVEKGPYWRLEEVMIRGNRNLSDSTLKLKMHAWRNHFIPGIAGRFREKELSEDIVKLTNYYRDKGFTECEIDSSIFRDSETQNVSILLSVEEGPLYQVEFTGNNVFSDSELMEDLIFLREGIKRDRHFVLSIKKMKEKYRLHGYPDTAISSGSHVLGEYLPVRTIEFHVKEGPRYCTSEVRIIGNHSIDEKTIREETQTDRKLFARDTVYLAENVDQDAMIIKVLYHKFGFLNAHIRTDIQSYQITKQQINVVITYNITEGVQTIVSSVQFKGLSAVSVKEITKPLKIKRGEPFRRYMIENDKNTISSLISERGYPYVSIEHSLSFNEDNSLVHLTYLISEGSKVLMGEVFVTGNFRTKDSIVKREIEMKKGDSFSLSRLLEGQRNVRDLEMFDSVTFKAIGLAEKTDMVNLIAEVKEKKPYFIQAGIGYESESGFFADTKTGDRNFLGTNKNLWLSGAVSQTGYRSDVGITEPRVLGSRIAATAGFFIERVEEFNQEFGTDTFGASLHFIKRWPKAITTELGFTFEQKKLFCQSDSGLLCNNESGELFDPRSIFITTPSISYDSRDSFVRPRKGVFTTLSIDVSKGIKNSFDDFLKYQFDGRYYISPFSRLTFAFLGRAGYLQAFGSSGTIPQDQLFHLGGISDVRGFAENMLRYDGMNNPVGGRFALSGSLEARFDIGHNFEITGFFDSGRVTRTYTDFGTDGFRSSIGAGLRYITPIGPVGFLYGFKLNPREDESSGRFHLSVGYTF
jgi:outer membrane protein insertion porin family